MIAAPLRRGRMAALAVLMAAAGCSSRTEDASAITPDDQRQLNEAAAVLDANRADADTGAHESSPHD